MVADKTCAGEALALPRSTDPGDSSSGQEGDASTARRPRVLIVTTVRPWRPSSGGTMRTAQLAARLAMSADVTLLALAGAVPGESCQDGQIRTSGLGPDVQADRVRRTTSSVLLCEHRPWPWRALRFATGTPLRFARWSRRLSGIPGAAPPDWVLFDHVHALAVLDEIRLLFPRARLAVDLHNDEVAWLESLRRHSDPLLSLPLLAETVLTRAFLAAMLPRLDLIVAVSTEEAAKARRLAPKVRVAVVENAAAIPPAVPPPLPREPVVLIHGSWDYVPNGAGLKWFMDEIARPLRARRPDARIVLAGSGAARFGWIPSDIEFEIRHDPDEMAPEFARARVVAVPVLAGAGTRIRVLDALAHGRPVVATGLGVEGLRLPVEDVAGIASGAPLVRADTGEAFTEALLAWLCRESGPDVPARAQALVASRTWDRSGRQFLAALAIPSVP